MTTLVVQVCTGWAIGTAMSLPIIVDRRDRDLSHWLTAAAGVVAWIGSW